MQKYLQLIGEIAQRRGFADVACIASQSNLLDTTSPARLAATIGGGP